MSVVIVLSSWSFVVIICISLFIMPFLAPLLISLDSMHRIELFFSFFLVSANFFLRWLQVEFDSLINLFNRIVDLCRSEWWKHVDLLEHSCSVVMMSECRCALSALFLFLLLLFYDFLRLLLFFSLFL